ncbi:MAG TPA: succinate dehydrogenase, cytochrome b556 subunit [Hyphomicrobiales bacterium]|nr:succinate dehydrogenase, cytochrome b556 subunit [Rhodobiaceae bacterium]HXK54378.1 succinate dehydrogenase, cytochrome b556 subunit [Hyphomicrobiales bacterium]
MADAKGAAERPLSPHLQIYKPIFTMVMSIVHRITGVALYFGMAALVWWLLAAASGPAYFEFVNGLFTSLLGRLVLLGFTWAALHHALGGLRHFLMDFGSGFGAGARNMLARLSLVVSLALTVAIWIVAYMVRGG